MNHLVPAYGVGSPQGGLGTPRACAVQSITSAEVYYIIPKGVSPMVRRYQKQRIAKTKTILAHLNHSGALAFDQITSAMLKGYKVTDKPSLSLIVQSVLIRFAKEMSSDQLKALRAEIKRHGCTPRKDDLKEIAKVYREVVTKNHPASNTKKVQG